MVAAAVDRGEGKSRALTRVEYEELVERGVLEDARVELLYGRIVSMSPQGPLHTYSVTRLARLLIQALGEDRAIVRVQAPFVAANESEPEPDAAIVAPGDYAERHPETALLLIEVADSSLARDREKAKLYAAARVPEYWIVNLVDAVVEVYRDPRTENYARVTKHGRADVLRLVSFHDVEVRVAELLPPGR
jgi:Uma2 family endonuclease